MMRMRSLVPRTRSSHMRAPSPIANFWFKRGTKIIELRVSLRFRSSHESVPRVFANFGIGTLAFLAASLALCAPPVVLAQTHILPAAVRLASQQDTAEAQTRLAREICRDHLICLAAMTAFTALQVLVAG